MTPSGTLLLTTLGVRHCAVHFRSTPLIPKEGQVGVRPLYQWSGNQEPGEVREISRTIKQFRVQVEMQAQVGLNPSLVSSFLRPQPQVEQSTGDALAVMVLPLRNAGGET